MINLPGILMVAVLSGLCRHLLKRINSLCNGGGEGGGGGGGGGRGRCYSCVEGYHKWKVIYNSMLSDLMCKNLLSSFSSLY